MAAASEFSEDDEDDDEEKDDGDEDEDEDEVGITMRPPICTGALFLAESEFNALCVAAADDCRHG